MTALETLLLILLYFINGAFMVYKEDTSSKEICESDMIFNKFFAFFLNPFWLIGVMIIKVFFKKW